VQQKGLWQILLLVWRLEVIVRLTSLIEASSHPSATVPRQMRPTRSVSWTTGKARSLNISEIHSLGVFKAIR
jgi:hypothetical protein